MQKEFSGKLLLRMESNLHRLLSTEAAKARVSLNSLLVKMLKERLEGDAGKPWWKDACDDIVKKTRARFGPKLVGILVFGSQIMGNATENSDLDILIVLSPDSPITRALYRWWDEIDWDLPCEVNPQFVRMPDDYEQTGGIWLEAALASDILWERGQKLTSCIKGIKQLIENDFYRRHFSSGQPYWIRRKSEKP